ncbi:MAG TPA: FG-GAP-like repeat-containing protein [Bryobacteraceae bacterium]|nr:FG-GAP-like repeat-containing protein [Bryobacteraceae bacterium]
MSKARSILRASLAGAAGLLFGFQGTPNTADQLAQARNLGKAFFENPTTQTECLDQFKKALDLSPDSVRERINYGLALLHAGKTDEGEAQLLKAQKNDPKIPHTWFNLGIAYENDSKTDEAIAQFQGMLKLVPDEPISHYNLGTLYQLNGQPADAIKEFEAAEKANPDLAGPHFKLANAWRATKPEDATRENKLFLEIKDRQKAAGTTEDLKWSYYAEIYDPAEAAPVTVAPAEVKLATGKIGSGATGLTVADIDGDGVADLIAWSASGIQVFKSGAESTDVGLGGVKDVVSVSAGDINNDGLPDLAIVTKSGAEIWTNNAGKFTKSTTSLPTGTYSSAVWLDYDHDYDLDLFLLGEKPVLMRNNGPAGFSDETKSFPFKPGKATTGLEFDVTPDTDGMDLIVAYADHPGVLYRDKLNGRYEAEDVAAVPAGTKTILAADLNNDRATDLVAATDTNASIAWNRTTGFAKSADMPAPGGAIALADFENRGALDIAAGGTIYRNEGKEIFKATKASVPARTTAMVGALFNGTHTSLAAINGSDIEVVSNTTAGNGALQISITGVKNLKLAYGSKVEVKAGSQYQKQTYRGLPLVFGIPSQYKEADTIRINWANGLIQNEVHQPMGAHTYKEAQRLSGSCPMIFTWNGHEFRFLTDVLGVAPLGASSGDGNYFPVDHDEYVQIPGEAMVPKDGKYEVRISEELREVSYIDKIRLIAVDHPADQAIYTNDKFKSPPFPEFRLFGVSQPIHPIAAHDDAGRDVLPKLLHKDRQYPDAFSRDFAGTAQLHHLDLDFGKAAPSNKAVMILSGWVDWADGSTFLQNSRESKDGLIMPYVQVKDAQGRWKTVIKDMGIPAGKPKTISVDMTGKFLSASREVRIVTNLCVYWDEIFLSENTAQPPVKLTSIAAQSADLHFRGFSKVIIDPARKQPENFLYNRVAPVSQWNPTPGFYTRYGDVDKLLTAADDMPVIMGSGDEMKLEFDPAAFPALRAGWKRDFLLFVDGWAKDADANTAFSTSVAPLPFHAMSAYPYRSSEHYPDDAVHRKYQKEYNTRPALKLLRPLVENGRT